MGLVKFLGGAVVCWLMSAAVLAWELVEVHGWWPFVPEMGFGTAMAVTFPALLGAFVVGVAVEIMKD